MARSTRPMASSWAARSAQLAKSNVRYCSSTARAMSWYSRDRARRTDVMFTARYERLRTRTFVFRTDACTPGVTVHGDPPGVNFASTSSGRAGAPPQHRPRRRHDLVELPLARGLGGLNHDRPLHDQGEVDRRGVEAVVEQALRQIERLH